MLRVLGFLIVVAVLALGAAWLADRPGAVAITWQGYRIETSVMVLGSAVLVLVALGVVAWSLLRGVVQSPGWVALWLRNRRGARSYHAMSSGLVAVGAGDVRAARRYADEVRRLAPDEPLALLLAAQTAQLSGDRAAAEEAFRQMAERDETKLIGLRGLFIEARRRDDAAAARIYAEEAARAAPALSWAGQAVLEFRSASGDWPGALKAIERNVKSGLLDRESYRRQRAVLLTARAIEAEDGDPGRARNLALEALKLAPDLVPAAALAGRLLAQKGELRKAARALETAWRANPHPDLAEAYAHLRFGDSARDRLTRVEALAREAPGHVESALAVARAALDAQEFARARDALKPLLGSPTKRVAMLMAEIEEVEHGDEGRAREWMARAVHAGNDPAWTADGLVSERWMPVSPISGRLDAFRWRVPVAELPGPGAVIEEQVLTPVELAEPIPTTTTVQEPPPPAPPRPPVAERQREPEKPRRRKAAAARAERKVEAVIPLVHAPDDPGTDGAPELAPDGRKRFFD